MNKVQWEMKSEVGSLYLVASGRELQGIFWEIQKVPMAPSLKASSEEACVLAETIRQLEKYFDGKLKRFDLPLDPVGTPFQRRVWAELRKIPYGETRSYRDVARAIQNEKAVRAVGTANGRNPLSIVVPCHRVIASDGSLAGYAGGLERKAKLLDLEKRKPA
jgi:methylated-DNA-[protein]-cysteine S-methyltransferase